MSPRALLGLAPLALVLAGCGQDNAMTQAQIDALKHPPAPTAADRQRMANAMAQGAQQAQSAEAAWAAKQDPEKIKRINADRAAMGRPPLGG